MSLNGSSLIGSVGVLLGKMKDQLQCGLCELKCDTVMKFIQHKITHVDRGNGQGCEICKLSFSRQSALYEHYRRKHTIIFDTIIEEPCIKAKRLKVGKSDAAKKRKEKAKNNLVKAGASLLNDGNLNHQTTAAISLPSGLSYNVNVDVGQLNEVTVLNDLAAQNTTGPLTNTHGMIQGVSQSGLPPNSVLPSSSLLISSSQGSTANLPGSSLIVIMQPQSSFTATSTVTSACSTQSNNRLILSDSSSTQSNNILVSSDSTKLNSTSSLTNLYNHSLNQPEFKKEAELSCIDNSDSKCSDFDGRTQAVFAKSFYKQISHNRTEAYGQVVLEKPDTANSRDIASSNNETGMTLYTPQKLPSINQELSMIKSFTNNSTGVQENIGKNFNDSLCEEETRNCKTEETDEETGSNKRRFSASESLAYCTRNFKKRGKLAPVAGKIPQELDMPDFCFIHFVTQGGKNEKSMHVGKDQFKCLFCSYVVRWRNSMCRHMREEHDNELLSGAALMIPSQSDADSGKVMKMTDYIAMEKAEKPNKRMRGVETQDMLGEYTCEQCGKIFNRLRYWRMHIQSHKKKKDILCALCSKTFKTQQNLIQHLKSHEEKEPYKCPECDFESSVNIAIHKHRQIHSGNSQICEICGQAYSDKSTLRKHKQVHDPARPFGCAIPGCTWRFRTKAMCDAHIQGHGSKRTFKCEVCGYAFRQKHHLQRHEKVVHNIVHEPKPSYSSYYSNKDTEYNGNQFEDISNDGQNEMEVTQGVNLIMNDGNISNVITPDHFDLESALQNGQLVIATDDGSINYEMSDIGSNVVYQTLLPDGEAQQFETQTICIPQTDAGHMVYEGVDSIQSEVEIEQS